MACPAHGRGHTVAGVDPPWGLWRRPSPDNPMGGRMTAGEWVRMRKFVSCHKKVPVMHIRAHVSGVPRRGTHGPGIDRNRPRAFLVDAIGPCVCALRYRLPSCPLVKTVRRAPFVSRSWMWRICVRRPRTRDRQFAVQVRARGALRLRKSVCMRTDRAAPAAGT